MYLTLASSIIQIICVFNTEASACS